MSLRFVDGFDHYNTNAVQALKWTTSGTPTYVAGRLADTAMQLANVVGPTKTLDNQTTWIWGAAVKWGSFTNNPHMAFRDAGTTQVDLRVTVGGAIVVTRNGTVLGTSSPVLSTGVWYYLEIKVVIHPSAGTFEVRLNGVNVLSASAQNTRNTANSFANELLVTGAGSVSWTVDDMYLCDGAGSVNNDFLGDVRIQTLYPTGAGNYSQFTPSTGSNWQNVDDTPPNGDTDYNSSATLNQIDTYQMTDLVPLTGSVFGVQVGIYARKDDAGARSIAPVIRNHATDSVGTNVALSTSYNYLFQLYETNPSNGGAAWNVTDVNATELGQKVTV